MKQGVASDSALEHGLEGSGLWEVHQLHNKYTSKAGAVEFVRLVHPKFEKENFTSDNSKLRGRFGDVWGYFVAPLIQGPVIPAGAILSMNDKGEKTATQKSSKKKKADLIKPAVRGRPRKKRIPNRFPSPGDPDLDVGAEMLMTILQTGLSLKDAWRRMGVARRLLNDYDQELPRKVKGKIVMYCRQHVAKADRSPAQQTLLHRWTVDLMPGFSRAIQRMLEDQGQGPTRKLLESATPLILAEFQKIFPEAKVVGAAWHVRSGQLHLDIWSHSTRLEVVPHGTVTVLARLWNATGLAHYGPGPGICAWDRHARALGDQAGEIAPGLLEVLAQTIGRQTSNYGSKANRDVRLHRAVDAIFENLLPQHFREVGMGEYKEWLQKQYALGVIGPEARRSRSKRAVAAEIKLTAILEGLQKIAGTIDDQQIIESGPIDPAETLAEFSTSIFRVIEAVKSKARQAGLEESRTLIEQAESTRKESSDVLDKARVLIDTAEFEGLRKARLAFLGETASESSSLTVVELATEFQREIESKADRVIQDRESEVVSLERNLCDRESTLISQESELQNQERKLNAQVVDLDSRSALIETRLTGVGLREDSAFSKEQDIEIRVSQMEIRESNLEKLEAEAFTRGLKTAYRFLNSNNEPSGATAAEILKEITTSVTRTVSDKLKGILRRFSPGFKSSATTLVEMDGEILTGLIAFETKALESGLEAARGALLGVDAPALDIVNETTLRESIQVAAGQLKTDARVEVSAALMGERLEKVIAGGKDPVKLVGFEFARLREVEASAKVVAMNAPQASPASKVGQALLTLRKLLKIDDPPGGRGGYGD